MGSLLSHALRYTELGYPVLPCVPRGKVLLTRHGCFDATTDAEQIRVGWTGWPDANVGMSTEGLLVVDVDGTDNPWPGDPEQERNLARTAMSLTPHGGRHY